MSYKIETTPMDADAVRALPAPALLRDNAGHLCVWDGTSLTRRDGTIVRDRHDSPWTLVAAPVPRMLEMFDRNGGVDSYRFKVFLHTGRDAYADSVARP